MPLAVGSFVWAKWRRDWYMGQVTEQEAGEQGAADEVSANTQIKVHIHGEPETRDKWYDIPSPNVVELVQVRAKETAIGAFPQAGDNVELLVMDEELTKLAPFNTMDDASPLLCGVVVRVYPARDASIVDVEYPVDYAFVLERRRRVWVSNGYIRVRRNELLSQ